MEAGVLVRVIKDFLTTTEGELCVAAGEILQVGEVIDKIWLRCATGGGGGREGTLPSANVAPVEVGMHGEGTRIFVADSEFQPEEEGDLHLARGAVVIGTARVDDYWYRGRTLDGLEGTFPPSYCWEPDPSNYVNVLKSRKHRVEKFAKVLHSMKAQLDGEIDLVEGDIVRIVEIIDRDWYRGETKGGAAGIFPASFVRVVDAFPGDAPSASANVKPYLDAARHRGNEYMNTVNQFKGLEEAMRAMGQQSVIQSVINGIPESVQKEASNEQEEQRQQQQSSPAPPQRDASVPQEIFQDDYFRKNLPSSYGSVSVEPPPAAAAEEQYSSVEQSIFSGEVRKCSMGFQEMSRNLRALGNGSRSGHYPYYSQPAAADSSSSSVVSANRTSDYTAAAAVSECGTIHEEVAAAERLTETMTKTAVEEKEEFSLTPKVDYNKVAAGLSVLKRTGSREGESGAKPSLDYTKLSQNLSVFNSAANELDDNHLSATERMLKLENASRNRKVAKVPNSKTIVTSVVSMTMAEKEQEVTRYQNITDSNPGYTATAIDVRPYAIARFNFVAEFETELSLGAGEMVYLNRYVDNEWLEGEVDGQRGIFPIAYVNVIVDCAMSGGEKRSTAVTVHENLEPDTYHRVLYNFSAQMEGDMTVAEAEVVLVVEKKSSEGDWIVVENSQGERGVMPGNHLDSKTEFEGKLQFDIERLMDYATKKVQQEPPSSSTSGLPGSAAPNPDLKFFDPLCSPGGEGEDEMRRVEEELERRAKEPRMLQRLQQPQQQPGQQQLYPYKRAPPPPPSSAAGQRAPRLVPKQPRDIETLITNNLSRLKSLQASPPHPEMSSSSAMTTSTESSKKISISQMVLEEMRGRNPEPVRPASGARYELDLAQRVDELIRETARKRREEASAASDSEAAASSPKPSTKRAAPPVPPAPKRPVKSPAPPRPPQPPQTPPIQDLEPIYSQINKEARKFDRALSGEERKQAQAPPPRPSRPPLLPALSLPVWPNHVKTIEVVADVHRQHSLHRHHPYDTPEKDESAAAAAAAAASTPTNEVIAISCKADPDLTLNHICTSEEDDVVSNRSDPTYGADLYSSGKNSDSSTRVNPPESVYAASSHPAVPERTSSILQREQQLYQETIQLERFGPPSFPPDRKSPMSPPGKEQPPKVASLPSCRSSSVSSTKSRSAVYASVASMSERGYSPAMSSLNHSYETLNMSETYHNNNNSNNNNNNNNNNSGGGPLQSGEPSTGTIQRRPHRPAPPVPVNEQFESSKAKLFPSTLQQQILEHQFQQGTAAVTTVRRRRTSANRRMLRQKKIHSLKRQIQIKEKMLEELIGVHQEQLLRELDMYQEIAVAKGLEYDSLNVKMDHCQESIETLSDEIQRLQACLADEEYKLEEDGIEETRRRAAEESFREQMEINERENRRRKLEAKIKKNREQRENVIGELVQTEREFCRDLKLTWQAFGLDTPELLERRGVDVHSLFGNLKDVVDVSEEFLATLQEEVKAKAEADEQMVGRCFLRHAEAMKRVYTEYCVNNDRAEQLLEKYEASPEVQRLLQKGVETLQSQVACFNMGSILIKPVQRILKYPLMLNELIKCTEVEHSDRVDLMRARDIMTDVASFINESKRRKDIVDKYKTEEDRTLTRKISKLNMHSINKKSSRMGQKFLNTIGKDPAQARDFNFDDVDRRFSHLSRSVQLFAADSARFRENLHDVAISQFNIAENVADLYKDKVHAREVERFRAAHRNIISTYWNQYNQMLQTRVIKPLQGLLDCFHGPTRLIQKRQDKHLDYSASLQKKEKNKEPSKSKVFQDDLDEVKTTYEALNTQLLEELPKFLDMGSKIYCHCVTEFILLRKLFVGRVTKELLSLMDLPLLASASGDILEVFLVKHGLVCTQLGRFSFSSKTFRPEDKRKTVTTPGGGTSIGQTTVAPQTAAIRTYLRGKYAAVKLFQAREALAPKDPLDIGVNAGDLVGVVQQKDPLGNRDRWFVDNGQAQGFVQSRVLGPIGDCTVTAEEAAVYAPTPPAAAPTPQRNQYDDVAPDEDEPNETSAKQPVRKAPPVPPATADNSDPPDVQAADDAAPDAEGKVEPGASRQIAAAERDGNYDEFPAAASEVETEASQDLSPIYEEIHGGSRSTVSSTASSGSSSAGVIAAAAACGKFHFSLFDFAATETTMISVARGQVVRVIQVTAGEWWYVEDRHGNRGYVPHTYLKSYPHSAAPAASSNSGDSEATGGDERGSTGPDVAVAAADTGGTAAADEDGTDDNEK